MAQSKSLKDKGLEITEQDLWALRSGSGKKKLHRQLKKEKEQKDLDYSPEIGVNKIFNHAEAEAQRLEELNKNLEKKTDLNKGKQFSNEPVQWSKQQPY
jgi:hypothetical protein